MNASDAAGGGVLGRRSTGSLLGIDSVPNWSSYFYYPGLDSFGNTQFTWSYTMLGKSPFAQKSESEAEEGSGTTLLRAPIIPVTVDMRDTDGSPRYVNGHRLILSPTDYIKPVLHSPVFSRYSYDSSDIPTQFADAIQRATFYHQASPEWHTTLAPSVKTGRTLVLPYGSYRYALQPDGTCCAFVLVNANVFGQLLFPSTPGDTTTIVGAAENGGDMLTTDIATLLFPNTFLYVPDKTGAPASCCILGYHTYDVEPGDAGNGWRERRYVLNYSSWVSPGIFNGGFADVTALSHEMVELFDDPFVNNATPWWKAPNNNCQNNLETGDVVEGLTNAVYPTTIDGVTYHPQNEALLPWFAGQSPSSAIHGAYSYPDISVLLKASPSQSVGCQ